MAGPQLRMRTIERTALVHFEDAEILFEVSGVQAASQQLHRLIERAQHPARGEPHGGALLFERSKFSVVRHDTSSLTGRRDARSPLRYETIGCDLRPILHNPKHTPLIPSAVERLFGVELDALL